MCNEIENSFHEPPKTPTYHNTMVMEWLMVIPLSARTKRDQKPQWKIWQTVILCDRRVIEKKQK